MEVSTIIVIIVLAPLLGSIVAGFCSKTIHNTGVNFFTITLCGLSFILSCFLAYGVFVHGEVYTANFYTWAPISDGFDMTVGFTVDRLSAFMMLIVTFVATLVHI